MSTLSTTHVNKTTDTRMKTHTSDNYDLIHNAKLNLSMQSHTRTELRFVKTHRFDDNVTECSRSQVLAFSEGETLTHAIHSLWFYLNNFCLTPPDDLSCSLLLPHFALTCFFFIHHFLHCFHCHDFSRLHCCDI